MNKIIGKLKLSAKHKCQNIAYNSIGQVTYDDQGKGQPYILRIENLAEFAVQITYVHQEQRIEPQETAEEDVIQQPAEKADQQPLLLPAHEPERRRQYNHEVRYDACERQGAEHTALQYETYDDEYGHNDFPKHLHSPCGLASFRHGLLPVRDDQDFPQVLEIHRGES